MADDPQWKGQIIPFDGPGHNAIQSMRHTYGSRESYLAILFR